MNATISDVARKAGVGVGTVSRVINRSPLVSEATRQKVLKAMEDLDYVPNPFARRLSLGKTLTMAVIVPFFTRQSFVERLRGVEAAMAETEYDLVLYNVETVAKRDIYFRQVPRPERVDGLLIISLSPSDEDVERFQRVGVPTVLVDTRHPELPHVIVDDVKGGHLATRHLIELGHRRIAFLGDQYPNPFNFVSSHDRYRGYLKALAEAGLDAQPDYYVAGEHGRRAAQELALQLLSLPEPPTAVFAASDDQALGVLKAARNMGLDVPRDLSVVGYDDIEIAEYLGLTTVRQLLFESGRRGVQLLLEALDNPEAELVCDVMPPQLIVRGTTAPPSTLST